VRTGRDNTQVAQCDIKDISVKWIRLNLNNF
jgi:hypothetical protein